MPLLRQRRQREQLYVACSIVAAALLAVLLVIAARALYRKSYKSYKPPPVVPCALITWCEAAEAEADTSPCTVAIVAVTLSPDGLRALSLGSLCDEPRFLVAFCCAGLPEKGQRRESASCVGIFFN